jgi:hypothetical protein
VIRSGQAVRSSLSDHSPGQRKHPTLNFQQSELSVGR